jgi:hypothetical protein
LFHYFFLSLLKLYCIFFVFILWTWE